MKSKSDNTVPNTVPGTFRFSKGYYWIVISVLSNLPRPMQYNVMLSVLGQG